MSLHLQILLLLAATASAVRPAHLARQLETCGVSCGDGWCCFEFESCVPDPSNTVDGGWSCVFQGVSNDDGSPITDEPFNPSSDAAQFNFFSSFIADQSQFLSSLTSQLSISSLSIKSVSAIPSPAFTSSTIAPSTSPTSPGPSSTPPSPSSTSPGPSSTSPSPSSTSTGSSSTTTSTSASETSSSTSSPGSSIGSSSSSSSTKIETSTTSTQAAGGSPTSNITSASAQPSQVPTSDTSSVHLGFGNTAALMLSFTVAAAVAYLA